MPHTSYQSSNFYFFYFFKAKPLAPKHSLLYIILEKTIHNLPLHIWHSWIQIPKFPKNLNKKKPHLCVFPWSNACRNSFAMERCQQFKVAAPQRGSLLLCKDDSWFYWFSHRECVPMAEWSIRTWRWRDIVYGVSVLQFWRCDARMMALLLHLPLQKFWFSSSEKFWSLSYKKKILNIHYSRNSDRRPLQWREDHPLCAISFLKNPPSTLNLLPNTLKPASQPPP